MLLYASLMSTAPLQRLTDSRVNQSDLPLEFSDADRAIVLANQDECVMNRHDAARGMVSGIILGALLWAGLILTGAALIK